MKKFLSLLMVGVLAVSLAACKKTVSNEAKTGKFEIALITDVGTIDDKSFNQGSWEGVVEYAKANNKTHKYYQPAAKSTQAYLDSIKLAVEGGAKVIVTPGFLFSETIYKAQEQYKDVKFILIDAVPSVETDKKDAEGNSVFDVKFTENTVSLLYAEHESGFLAGYAAVKDGNTKLGFMGGLPVPAVVKFGYGFLQGAELAAKEENVDVSVDYTYLLTFNPGADVQTKASAWYQNNVEAIFVAAGGAGNSVMAAADNVNKKVIGVDVDQSGESKTVITSAMKLLKKSVNDELANIYKNEFKGGEAKVLSAKGGFVGLPLETSKFTKFNKEMYDALYAKLQNGEVKVSEKFTNDVQADINALGLTKVKVNLDVTKK